MKKGNRIRKAVRAPRAPLYIALSVFAVMAVALSVLLAGRSKAFALTVPADYAMPMDELTGEGSGISKVAGKDNEYSIDDRQGFITLARVSRNTDFENCTFRIARRDSLTLSVQYDENGAVQSADSFLGIGDEEHPFRGQIILDSVPDETSITMTGWKVLFNNLSTRASITSAEGTYGKKQLVAHEDGAFSLCDTLTVESDTLDISGFRFASSAVETERPAGLVAAKAVCGKDYTAAAPCGVDLTHSMADSGTYEVRSAGTVGGLFGSVESGVALDVTLPNTLTLTATTAGGHAGALVGKNNGSLTVKNLASLAATATAGDSYAAGIVGVNSGKIDFANAITVSSSTATGTTAGVVVGENKSGAEVNFSGNVTLKDVTATGNIVGGVAGASEGSFSAVNCTVESAKLTATGDNPVMGGFVGKLTTREAITVNYVSVSAEFVGTGDTAHTVGGYFGLLTANAQVNFTSTATSNFTFDSVKSGDVGGIIGKVSGGSAVTVSGIGVVNTFRNNDFSGTLGGAVGTVESGAYLKTENLSVTNTMSKTAEGMADLVGVAEGGAIVDVSGLTYKNTGKDSVLVSKTGKGSVLRLSGTVEDKSDKPGHIVRTQDNSLLYAEDDAKYISATPTRNDVGNYGQILRNGNIGKIIHFDETTHAVTLDKLDSASNIQLSNHVDAAKLAITLQTHGVFSGVTGIGEGNYTDLLSRSITLTGDIDLTNTGVEQFTCAAESAAFTGTVNGDDHTLTLAIGETIRKVKINDSTQNVGILMDEVNARAYLGAFSALSNATVKNLTVGGTVTYKDHVGTGTVRIGGLAGYASNSVSISDCTTRMSIKVNASSQDWRDGTYAYIGGFVGQAESADLTVKDNTIAATIDHKDGYLHSDSNGNFVFLGGAIGKAEVKTGKAIYFTGNIIQAKVNQTVQVNNAHVGGFIGDLVCANYVDVDMTGTKAEQGASISTNASYSQKPTAGGLIGYSFQKCRLTLDSAWAGTVNAQNSVGGLLYKLDGKLTVNNGFSVNECTFTSKTGDRGILLGDGTDAFVIVNCDSSGFASVTANGFDLFVGKNITATASNGVAAEGGLVTVETGDGIGKLPVSSEWYTLMNSHSNGNTRYYFNVAGLEGYQKTTEFAAKDLIYWNVYDFVQKALPDYVMANSFPTAVNDIENKSADVDLSGYCFYPTKKEGVTFDFGGHTLTFGVENPPTAAQFYGLQSGVFSDITPVDNGDITANFRNVVLAGTVQPVGNNSGAFICGKVEGIRTTNAKGMVTLNVEKVFLDGLTIKERTDTPLLINSIRSNSNCNITSVSQYTQESYQKETKTTRYTTNKVAGCLIGSAGIQWQESGKTVTSEYVYVNFSDIVFAGKTENSIFTTATLLGEINCTAGTGSFTYNFDQAEDWTENGVHINAVTYGKELATNPLQHRYYDTDHYVNPESYPSADGNSYERFSSGYMEYVPSSKGAENLRVNQRVESFDDGWGTYEHPYIISRPEQLRELAKLVTMSADTTFPASYSIKFPVANSSGKTVTDYTQCNTYTGDSSNTLKSGTLTLTAENLREYLRGAYFKIISPIVLDSDFTGIGNAAYPFHGVIVGADADTRTTITMPAKADIGSAGYGFINTANGCAVYGLTIQYSSVGLSDGSYSEATSRPFNGSAKTGVSHFGGVIAWVIGGDNVVDNVSVSVETLTAGHKTSVFGGYVGFVTGGGVTVRNLGSAVSNEQTEADSGYYYYNPYVGKVLCGYVLSDGERYNNTDKNFDIPIITKKTAATLYQKNTFTLADADDMYMLGFAINGGAFGYTDNTVSYGSKFGALSRNGNYAKVGVKSPSGVLLTDGRYADDETAGGKTIFNTYFSVGKGVNLKGTDIDIQFSGANYDLSAYPNAFRGFGSPYYGGDCFKIRNVTGQAGENNSPATTITLNMDMKQYYWNSTYEPDSVKNLALIPERTDPGIGHVFSYITVSGKVALAVYSAKGGSKLDYKIGTDNKFLFCQAGFVSYAESSQFSNVAIRNLTVESPGWAAGLVTSENDTQSRSSVTNCRIENLKTKGLQSSGAVYAFLRAKNATLQNITVTNSEIKTQASGLESFAGENYNASVGGLVGYTQNGKLTVGQSSVSDTAVLHLTKRSKNNDKAFNGNAGGLVGCLNNTELSLADCQVDGSVVATVLVNANDTTLAPDYAETVGLKNAVFDKAQNMAAYLLDKDVSNIVNSSAGGFVGYSTGKITMNSVRLTSNARYSTVILGSDNAGGFVGVGTAAQTYTDLTAQTDTNPIYIIGKSRAAGVTAYGSNAVTATNITVQGTEAAPVYILADGTSAPAAGLFAEINSSTDTLNSENAELSGCVIAGANAAGAVVNNNGHAELSNLKIFGNFIQGGSNSATGVLGTAAISRNTTLDGLYLGSNVIRKGGAVSNAGLIAGTLNGGYAVFIGYDLLLKGNDAGYGTAKSTKEILSAASRADLYYKATDTDQVGLVAYENLGTVNILAISAEEANYPRIVKESSGINPVLVFAGYGAPTVFESGYKDNKAYTPKQALADCGITVDGLKLNGDPVTVQDTQFTPDFLRWKIETGNDKLWKDKNLQMSGSEMKALSELVSGITANQNLPVLRITGKTDETMTAFLNLITNGGYGAMGSAFHIQSATSERYRLADGGTLSKVEGDTGSIGYENGKFVAGKYDNLESDDKTLSVLTVTLADAANSHTYTLHAVVYYPQILEYRSAISALEGEVYQLSSFRLAWGTESKIDIMAGSKFSFYIEYAYNSVAAKIENYNLDKLIYSHGISGTATSDGQFTRGTKMVLIDLNSTSAAGFQSYYYTVEQDTDTVNLNRFQRGEKVFDEILLQQVVEAGLAGKITDSGQYPYAERYLMVVIPPEGVLEAKQYNLVARVPDTNEKNLTVRGQEQSGNITVWRLAEGNLQFDSSQTSTSFSNTPDKLLRSALSVRQTFDSAYCLAMNGRALYGTHVFKIVDAKGASIMLPAGTLVTLSKPDGTPLMSTRLTQAGSSVQYAVGNVLEGINSSHLTYEDDIVISLDFSGTSPREFNRSFEDGGMYRLQDTFFLSGDREHYASGTETDCQTETIKAEKASPIKLALIPENRKSLAINFGNLAETTDNGVINFDLATDFSAIEAEGVKIDHATVTFSVQKKALDGNGTHAYRQLAGTDTKVVKALTGAAGGANVIDQPVSIQTGGGTDKFCLTVDMETIRSTLNSPNEQLQDYNVLTNYRLVAEVTVTGTDAEGKEVTNKATSYFTFLLCNIYGDM